MTINKYIGIPIPILQEMPWIEYYIVSMTVSDMIEEENDALEKIKNG